MNFSIKEVINRLKEEGKVADNKHVLHILNGQVMHDQFRKENVMKESKYIPFNEAMCINPTTAQVFNKEFITCRTKGHKDTIEHYTSIVIEPLELLLNGDHDVLYLWFGEDMFCQINLLTILAYLEQSGYSGDVILNSFKDREFIVNQTELDLGTYNTLYQEVLVDHKNPSIIMNSLMERAITLYLEMLEDKNRVTEYILENKNKSSAELLNELFEEFDYIGYGDTQYIELIDKVIVGKGKIE